MTVATFPRRGGIVDLSYSLTIVFELVVEATAALVEALGSSERVSSSVLGYLFLSFYLSNGERLLFFLVLAHSSAGFACP